MWSKILRLGSKMTSTRTMSTTLRNYPTEPRVGIGVCVLRRPDPTADAQVLLIRRGKPPQEGKYSFPGGSLELGETIIDCAIRECAEETAIKLKDNRLADPNALFPSSDGRLDSPVAFAAVDVMARDDKDSLEFHYAIIEVAAVPEDVNQIPVAGEDAASVEWIDLGQIRKLYEAGEAVPRLAEVAEEAVRRFKI